MPADAAIVVDARTTFALEMAGISKRFPGVVALENVDLRLEPGKVHPGMLAQFRS